MSLDAPPLQLVHLVDRAVPGLLPEFVRRVNRIRGVTAATSWYRSPERNREVGGARDSQHLFGLGVDLVGDLERIERDARAQGLIAKGFSRHVHIQGWPAGVARSSGFLAFLGL